MDQLRGRGDQSTIKRQAQNAGERQPAFFLQRDMYKDNDLSLSKISLGSVA